MKNSVVNLFLCIAAAYLCGCTSMIFSEYTGHDASSYLGTWPMGSGTMAEGAHGGSLFSSGLAVPVYRGWPERQYQVLGSLRFNDPNKTWGYDQGILKDAASEAKRRGADAIIIRQGAEFGISQIAGTGSNPSSVLSSSQTTALAIRWLTQQEIDERGRLVSDYANRFAAQQQAKQSTEGRNNAKIAANPTVAALVLTHLYLAGQDLRSADLWDKFAETMTKLVGSNSKNPAGVWIFKATTSLSTAVADSEGRNFLGLASISMDGENLTIVSNSKGVEMNFNGTLAKGRLSGQLGMGSVSSKCEGAVTGEKISISFQSLTSNGTVSGSIVLQRLPSEPNENQPQN